MDGRLNRVVKSENLTALRSLPDASVELIYVDPPFNTGQAFEQYDDSLEHSVWLGMMRERLILIRELLTLPTQDQYRLFCMGKSVSREGEPSATAGSMFHDTVDQCDRVGISCNNPPLAGRYSPAVTAS